VKVAAGNQDHLRSVPDTIIPIQPDFLRSIMTASSIVRVLGASALFIVAASSARAQTATQAASAAMTAAATPWAAVPAGTYELLIQLPDNALPATVVVRDSSGVPTATFQPEGDPAQPVKIAVKGTELTLNGDAPKGPFEIVLLRQGNDITGRWTYGGDTGKLTGKADK